jgi:transcriptional regulator with XRE-family HTH domain
VDRFRFGRALRALRERRDLRQDEVGAAAEVSRTLVSRVERGLISNVPFGTILAIGNAVGAEVELLARLQGEQLDRLIDERHARTLDASVRLLTGLAWEVEVEATYSIYGERGSIDLFAASREVAVVLVTEVKASVPEASNPIIGLNRKARLAPLLARDRGWPCRGVGQLLVIAEGSTSRRRVARHEDIFRTAFPVRGRDVTDWLARPTLPPIRGLLFIDPTKDLRARHR